MKWIVLIVFLFAVHNCQAASVDYIPAEIRNETGCNLIMDFYVLKTFAMRQQLTLQEFYNIPYLDGVPKWRQDFLNAFVAEVYAWSRDPESFKAQEVHECIETHV